jgi:acyl-CoA thioester hydrolase
VIGLVVQTQCHYFAPLAFPADGDAGLRVAHVGRSSVRYEVGLFAGDAPLSAAPGHFTHVYVDRARAARSNCRRAGALPCNP